MEDLSLHILDVAENSIEAGATRVEIRIDEDSERDMLVIEIKDNGRGMDEETVAKVTDPFYTTKTVRRVGLGLPLLKQAAEKCDGHFLVSSGRGKGTLVSARFKQSHIDRQPLGDMAATMTVLIAGRPHVDFFFQYRKDGYTYTLDTRTVRKELEDVPINAPAVLRLIRDDIQRGLTHEREEIHGKT